MDRQQLTAQQEAEAQRVEEAVMEACQSDIRAMVRLMASKPDRELLGKTEFELRDICHRIGAKVIETTLQERKKGGT
jgi:hypothetical protein